MSLRSRSGALLGLLGLLLACFPVVDATTSTAASNYTVTVIGPFSRLGRQAMAMNAFGHVTGEGAGNGVFLYDGSLHALGKPAGSQWAVGQGISDRDVIAVTAQKSGIRTAYAVSYANGRAVWTALPRMQGFPASEASAILPDGSAIAGSLCATGDGYCGWRREQVAVVWKRSGARYLPPILLPSGKGSFASSTTGIARDNTITVVTEGAIASDNGAGHGIWLLHGHSILNLAGPGRYTDGYPFGIAHGKGSTFYIAGEISRPDVGTVTQGVVWTVTCTVTACRQTNRQILTTFGQVFAVNSHGAAVGYSRPNGDGAGFNALWELGKTVEIPATPAAINAAGQIAGWRVNPSNFHTESVLLTPSR